MTNGRGFSIISTTAVAIVLSGTCLGQPRPHPTVRDADRYDRSGPLRDIRPIPPRAGELRELPRKQLPNRDGSIAGAPDTAVQSSPPSPSVPAGLTNFEGINNVDGVLPPDTNGDIGPNHYVQTVNLSFAIYTRTGFLLYGPADTNTIWSGFGGACQSTNNGDPIVLYDHLADRWLISQFALPNFPFGPFHQCIAISQTGDPTGAWHRYAFLYSNTKMNDYPKFGVWPDGYYMTANQFNQASLGWGGQGVVAFERDKMLLGQPARMVYFDLYNTDPNLGGMLPADLDGLAPPAGAPNYLLALDDTTWGYPADQLELWEFDVNWTTPLSSTLTKTLTLPTVPFNPNMCGYARNCIPQPGTAVKLDAISDRLMYRLQYRNFGTHQTLVTNHTVDANGSDRAGIRWYELRKSGGAWSINQQSTYSPDTNHRWMGSAAMNGQGSIGLGYSMSNASTKYPSIDVTGRLSSDALNTMTQGELEIRTGTGSQTHSASRWGDYSSLSVDPTDDCTFWYTTEYLQTTGSAPWRTRIGSFTVGSCVPVTPIHDVAVTLVDAPASVVQGTAATVAVTVANQGNVSENVTVTVSDTPSGGGSGGTVTCPATFALAGGASTTVNCTWNTSGASTGTHTLNAAAIAADENPGNNTGSDTSNVTTPPPTLPMHVGDLDGTSANSNGPRWKATVTITVHNASEGVLSGATVSGSFSPTGGSGSCTTSGAGTCNITSGNIRNSTASTTFTVTNVSKSGYTYASSANHDVDLGTNGTTITINKP